MLAFLRLSTEPHP